MFLNISKLEKCWSVSAFSNIVFRPVLLTSKILPFVSGKIKMLVAIDVCMYS